MISIKNDLARLIFTLDFEYFFGIISPNTWFPMSLITIQPVLRFARGFYTYWYGWRAWKT